MTLLSSSDVAGSELRQSSAANLYAHPIDLSASVFRLSLTKGWNGAFTQRIVWLRQASRRVNPRSTWC